MCDGLDSSHTAQAQAQTQAQAQLSSTSNDNVESYFWIQLRP